jgi:hypothetical protein
LFCAAITVVLYILKTHDSVAGYSDGDDSGEMSHRRLQEVSKKAEASAAELRKIYTDSNFLKKTFLASPGIRVPVKNLAINSHWWYNIRR